MNVQCCDDPWVDWLSMLPHQPCSPLDAELEYDIKDMIAAADRRRLAVQPSTALFTTVWQEFRQQHEYLETIPWRRELRYLIWRAAALKVKLTGSFQDVIDYKQCRDNLAETERSIGGGDIDHWLWWAPSFNWADAPRSPHPLSQYAAIVLSLLRQSNPSIERKQDTDNVSTLLEPANG